MSENKIRMEDENGNVFYPHTTADVTFTSTGVSIEQVHLNHVAEKNPHGTTKADVGLGSVQNYGLATQAEAEAGTSTTKYMTPQRTKQAVDKNLETISQSIQDVENRVTTNLEEKALKVTVENQFNDRAVNVKDFGAVGDGGITDSTQAFINAIAACPPGGKVLIPPAPNFYKVLLGSIVIDKSITLEGLTSSDDQNGGNINSCRIVMFENGDKKTTIQVNASGVTLKNFSIYGAAGNGAGNSGIRATARLNLTIERVWVRSIDFPFILDQCFQTTFRQVNVRDAVRGFWFESCTSILLEQCWVQNCTFIGYYFNNVAYCTLLNCLLDGSVETYASRPDNAILIIDSNTVNIVGCASERTKNSHIAITNSEEVTISNYFGTAGNGAGSANGHSFAVINSASKNVVFINPRDHAPSTGTVASITKTYTGSPPVIIGGNLPYGYNDQGAIITVPTGAVMVGLAGIVEDAIYLKASDTGVRKKLIVNGANTISAVNA